MTAKHRPGSLISVRPRANTIYVSHGSTVLATRPDGTIDAGLAVGAALYGLGKRSGD